VPALLLLLAVALAGCGGSSSSAPKAGPSSSPAGNPGQAAPAATVVLGKVAGNLHQPNRGVFKKHRKAVLAGVGSAVDSWIQGGFVGVGYPRSSFPAAFATFTTPAARDAAHQQRLMTNQKLAKRIDGVTVKHQHVVVDVLAPHGRPAGATAHVRLVFTTSGHVQKRVTITGRLFLVPSGHRSWQVFGYDVARGVR
jgi:hypothetical protein